MTAQENQPEGQSAQDYWERRTSRIDEILESWRTAASFAVMALKSAILLNGAAAVAMLAFIANLYGDKNSSALAATLVPVLRHFLIGAFIAVGSTAAAYFSAYAENRGLWLWVLNNKHSGKLDYVAFFFQLIAIIFVGYAYWRFWMGLEMGISVMSSA